MSAANVELVKAVFPEDIDLAEVLASDNPVVLLIGDADIVAPDFEVEFGGTHSGAPPREYRGLEGLLEGWRDWLEPYDSYHLTVEEVIDAGANVLTLVRVRARTARHGVALEHRPAAVWTISEGKLTGAHFFLERGDAFEFAGLAPP
jgi:ketosteroid isomerase-like protein